MSDCRFCGATGLTYHENLACLVNEVTGKRHGKAYCEPRQIALYLDSEGIWPRDPQKVLHDLVNDAVRLGLNPWNFRREQRGRYVMVKRN
jgi:hypothetical protein